MAAVSVRKRVINIVVRERFLSVDDARYPLANIARVRSPKVKVKFSGAFYYLLPRVVTVAVLVVGLMLVAGRELTFHLVAGSFVVCVATSGLLAVVAACLTLHALVVETTGPPAAIVVSRHRAQILDLVERTTHAINNPQAEFEVSIEKVQFGDDIVQVGSDNIVNKR